MSSVICKSPVSSCETYYGNRASKRMLQPRVDIVEYEKEYKLFTDLPGMTKEDVTITLENNTLEISGERSSNRESSDDEQYRYFERRFGSFARRFKVPKNVNSDKIAAKMKHGVLEITLEKDEEKLPKEITIDVK